MAAAIRRSRHDTRSRLRVRVVQVLVLALFATLFGRLWYLQIFTGESYRAAAAHQSVRDLVVQPARGLIVDDMGRPLVANRASWVVSVDRTLLNKMDEDERLTVLRRTAKAVGVSFAKVKARSLLCGQPGSQQGVCWNGSPFQPVPVANDVPQRKAVRILEQAEDFPGVVAQRESLRSYPRPYGINAAHLLGYLSPITEGELKQAEEDGDRSVNGASVVGRAGVEYGYDKYLRGIPGYKRVTVDSMGRVLGDSGRIRATEGSTVVTSIDARVQSVVEKQLHETIQTARQTVDKVTGRRYVADAGAAVVLDARTGRVVAMASQPTYDPSIWIGGITSKQLKRLYSKQAGTPLLSRATQGQFAPGSTWKPFMTVGALANGYTTDSRLDCSSAFRVGNRDFKNYESGAYGSIGFDKALEVSCNTFFYRIGYDFWRRYGSDVSDVNAKDPLVAEAKRFGFGAKTGLDIPGEAAGRIADRKWKRAYYDSQKSYYCKLAKQGGSDFLHRFAREFCLEGFAYRAGDAVNFAIGQGDTIVTPLQLARAYAALSNGGTLYEPRVVRAIVDPQGKLIREIKPKVQAKLRATKVIEWVDQALKGIPLRGTLAWRMGGFPLEQVQLRGKTGSAEVYGKQSTSWLATYSKDYVVVMMVSQGGTGSGTSGPAVRKIWEALYGVRGERVVKSKALIPGTRTPAGLPVFAKDGSILPPVVKEQR